MIIMMRITKIHTSSCICVAACGTAVMMNTISATPVDAPIPMASERRAVAVNAGERRIMRIA